MAAGASQRRHYDLVMASWSDLNVERVQRLARRDNRAFTTVWPNILWVAEQFWQAQSDDEVDHLETWHHLVMSVGNFKRQGGTQICLFGAVPVGGALPTSDDHRESCRVQLMSGEVVLHRDEPSTWARLNEVKGLGVATSTTLLSALWPGAHVIVDRRDLNAAIALNLAQTVDQWGIDPDSSKGIQVSWDWYQWLRERLLSKAEELRAADPEIRLDEVERALYTLDGRVERVKGEQSYTWSEYAAALDTVLLAV